ncbi:MAG: hypothetical protein ACFCVD_05310 [Nodosilinea sp.]
MKRFNISSKAMITMAGLALAMTLGIGYGLAKPGWGNEGHGDHTIPHGGGSGTEEHGHGSAEISPGQPVPTINLVAYPDPAMGWNLEIQTTNFRFAPEHVNQASQLGEGHAHLYINGEKISRIYGPWLHIPHLPSGRNEITVGLNTNGHEALTHNGEAIAATVVVEVP